MTAFARLALALALAVAAGFAFGLVCGVCLSQNAALDDIRVYSETLRRWIVMYESLSAACAERPR